MAPLRYAIPDHCVSLIVVTHQYCVLLVGVGHNLS